MMLPSPGHMRLEGTKVANIMLPWVDNDVV